MSGSKVIAVDIEMAKVLGVNEAIVLNKVHYWISKNKEKKINYKNGRYWTFNTIKKWHEDYFGFWSERTVRRIFTSLESKGILVVGNFNKRSFDRTKWYSIDYDRLKELIGDVTDCDDALAQNEPMDEDELLYCNVTNCHNEKGQIVSNNTNNNTNNTTVITQQQHGRRVVAIEAKGMLREFLGSAYTNDYANKVIKILDDRGESCSYLKEKIDIIKRKNVENKLGFLIAALKNDYKAIKSDDKMSEWGANKNKNSFINFEQTVYKYSKEELDEIIRRKNRF